MKKILFILLLVIVASCTTVNQPSKQVYGVMMKNAFEKDSNKSKNFKIISPSIYEHCADSMEGWENEDVSDKISKSIILNIDKIINSNKIYIKVKNYD